jgi:hypothetical protein
MKSRPAGWCVNELHQRSHLPLQRFAALYHGGKHTSVTRLGRVTERPSAQSLNVLGGNTLNAAFKGYPFVIVALLPHPPTAVHFHKHPLEQAADADDSGMLHSYSLTGTSKNGSNGRGVGGSDLTT